MAEIDFDTLMNFATEGKFEPYAYYGCEEDALTFYFNPAADYARRINSRVTVFLSLETNELVGCQIKSVRHVLEDIGWFDVAIKTGKVRLDLLFVACHADFDDPDARPIYRQIGQRVKDAGIEVDVPGLVMS